MLSILSKLISRIKSVVCVVCCLSWHDISSFWLQPLLRWPSTRRYDKFEIHNNLPFCFVVVFTLLKGACAVLSLFFRPWLWSERKKQIYILCLWCKKCKDFDRSHALLSRAGSWIKRQSAWIHLSGSALSVGGYKRNRTDIGSDAILSHVLDGACLS